MLDVINENFSVSRGGSEASPTDSEHVVIFGGIECDTIPTHCGSIGPCVGAHADAEAADGLLVGFKEDYEVLDACGLLDARLSPALDLGRGSRFNQAVSVTDTDGVVLVVI